MSQSLGNTIGDSLQLSLNYGERLLTGIDADRFGRFSSPGGIVIQSNHPAFIYGHLSLYAPQILRQLGRNDLDAAVPESFASLFSKDQTCLDDPESTVYPPMDEVITAFKTGYGHVMTALRQADDALLQQENPLGGRMTELFPTLGSLHCFYTGGHMMIHFGQLSAWRRMEGLGAA